MNIFTRIRRAAGKAKRSLRARQRCSRASGHILRFTCNICGAANACPVKDMAREGDTCYSCTSSVRMRSVIHALSMELFEKSLALADFPVRKDITGIGLSDWEGYAPGLAEKLGYTNTFYHQAPFLDLSSDDAASFGTYDFVICSDVFEHIAPPISKAFENARRLLKPGGVMIFTVPYRPGETEEHYPELARYSMSQQGDEWVLENETVDGRKQTFPGVKFHGGPGTVVEMRVFGADSLARHFAEAGFARPTIHAEEQPQSGIVWNPYVAEEAPYDPPIYALDTPPWAVRAPRSPSSGSHVESVNEN